MWERPKGKTKKHALMRKQNVKKVVLLLRTAAETSSLSRELERVGPPGGVILPIELYCGLRVRKKKAAF